MEKKGAACSVRISGMVAYVLTVIVEPATNTATASAPQKRQLLRQESGGTMND